MPVKYSKLSDYKIKKIIGCFCSDVDATKTAEILKLNRKTINRYFRLFREVIFKKQQEDKRLFFGEVELDEAYFGAKRLRGRNMPQKRGRGTWKQPVFGVFERDGRVYTELVPDAKRDTLRKVIQKKISVESVVITDGWRGYNGLLDIGYNKHYRIDKSKSFSNRHGVHINGIESFWSFTKRRLAKFNGVKKTFDLHLKECEWRWKKSTQQMEKELWKMLLKY
ncbi:IS1595 family transposase [Nonlabens spongiae]|uniref:IS1595 family transposase n=1 Tax=Nonlabens spongiae TaxID=331648 RepID=A0A1W6MKQ6_9FLAO|nr:IS1595 family transposase [Nonlabens spongiae]ARN78157.1 IS1595 family transposase [Nonlabens spongiae]ARN78850.1 IS1595 family transposase [Nonlabens spongiae]